MFYDRYYSSQYFFNVSIIRDYFIVYSAVG